MTRRGLAGTNVIHQAIAV